MTEPEHKLEADDVPRPAGGVAAGGSDGADAPATVSAPHEPDASTPPASTMDAEATGDPLFDALWAKVLSSWDDDKVHAAVLEYSVTAERLPDLAGRYRAFKDHPTKGARAQKRLDAIVLAATQLMMSMRTPANTKVPLPITLSVAGLFAVAVLFVAYAMFHRQ